jgi:hypothetical protein
VRPESDRRPLAEGFVVARRVRCETVFAALALIAVAALSAVALVDPPLAGRLAVENGVVEWLQVRLDACSGATSSATRARPVASRRSSWPSSPA